MCSAKAPKAPATTQKVTPRVLLSRSQYDDLLIGGSGYAGNGAANVNWTRHGGGGLKPTLPNSAGGNTFAELRIA